MPRVTRSNSFSYLTVADPGFSRGGNNSQGGVIFSTFCRKLHENERIWTGGGGGGMSLANNAKFRPYEKLLQFTQSDASQQSRRGEVGEGGRGVEFIRK